MHIIFFLACICVKGQRNRTRPGRPIVRHDIGVLSLPQIPGIPERFESRHNNNRSIVTPPDKLVSRPNTGNKLRSRAKTARQRFIETDVTEEEHGLILTYCLEHKISVSQFLSDVTLEDASNARARKDTVRVTAEFEISAAEYDKLELLVHLHRKQDVGELIHSLLQPHLDLQRIHTSSEMKSVRFYLSDAEHQKVTKHIASHGIPARKYASFLALRRIRKSLDDKHHR
jgi:hypothetical protein